MAVPQIRDLDPTSADVLLEIRQVLADVHALLRQNDAAREQLSAVLQDLPADDVIRRARMHRKIAALGRYDPPHGLLDMQAALGVLGRATGSRPDAWRQEWVQVQFELAITHYARGDVERMEAIAHELEPFVRSHGNPSQQADFANQMLLVDCWRNRFRSTERALRYATEFVEAAERADDLPTLAAACHSYGMIKLHQGAMAEAERSFDRCLELCDRCGYRSAQVRGLMYYAVLRRRQGDLAAAADYSLRGVTLARQAGMRMYEHTYEAMGSWHAYRHRDFATAVRLAQAALQGWADMGARYPFQWIATLPLLAAALAIDDESSVLTCLRDLTSLAQQYLAQELMEAIEQAVAAPGRECFAAVVASAHRTAYL
jgi:tetratricopeptide (TPR) repeat protein